MKHLKHLFIALLLLCCLTANAHDFRASGIYYYITSNTDKTVCVTYRGTHYNDYNEYTGSVVIPESVKYNGTTYSVTSIGGDAFAYCSGLTSVVIPNSVTSIGDYAFYGCTGLTSVVIGNSVTSIGNYAFNGCTSLKELRIEDGEGTLSLGYNTYGSKGLFYDCPLETLYLGRNLSYKTDSNSPFYNIKTLASVTIGNSVTSIGDEAFFWCTGLTSVTIPNSVTSIGYYAFLNCTGLTSVEFNAENCTTMGSSYYPVFRNCTALSTVTIGENVKTIPDYAFCDCTGLTSITIPNSVTSIGGYAFYNCTGLTSVEFNAENCTTMGSYDYPVFSNCTALSTITIGENVKNIPDYAFYKCTRFTSITIPNSVTSIGYYAFYNCTGLTSITIPNSVTRIGSSAFYGTAWYNNQPDGVVYAGKVLYKYKGAMPKNTSITIKEGTLGIAGSAFYGYTGLTNITIPNSVTSIGNEAFYNCTGLKTVYNFSNLTFSKGSSDYGYVAYYAYKVYNAPNGSIEGDFIFAVENIFVVENEYTTDDGLPGKLQGSNHVWESPLLQGKTNTIRITVLDTNGGASDYEYEGYPIVALGELEFYDGDGNKIVYTGSDVATNSLEGTEGSLANLCDGDYSTFYHSTWSGNGSTPDGYVYLDVKFPSQVDGVKIKIVGRNTKKLVPNHIKVRVSTCIHALKAYIGKNSNVVLPAEYKNRNYEIADSAFLNNTTIASITIPDGVASIGKYAFSNCTGLTSVTIPNSVTSIGDGAFSGCTWLTSITIPNSVTSIGESAFRGCSGLTSVEFNAENCTTMGSSFDPVFYGCTALSIVTIGENVTSIPSNAFYGCTGLTSIEIPNSVTRIGEDAFNGCTGLTSITIPNSVTSIEGSAFYGCTGLTNIEIPNSVTSIEGSAFYGCTGLTNIEIPNSVTSIEGSAFYGCTGLTSITIPNSVKSIGEDAFRGCTGLKTIYNFSNLTFSEGSEDYGYVAYYADKVYNAPNGSIEGDFIFGKPNDVNTLVGYLGNATELTLPADYNGENYTIGNSAFYGCTGLTNIEIPNSVTSIGDGAFSGCTGLTSITIPNSVTSVGEDAFAGCTNVEKLYLDCAEVGDWFSGVSAMKEVTIGNSVTSVVASAFNGCTGLEKVCINDLGAWYGIDFASADANPLYYAKNLYLNGELLTELSIPAEIAEVKDYAFYNCNGVTNIDIVDGVKSIGSNAFYGCSDLETLYISNTIESIGDYAFAECNNIFDIKIGSKKAITASENVFSSDAYNNACLYVPTDRKEFYAKTSPWSNFIIREMDFTGIEELKSENGKVKTIYDLNGRAVEKPANDIYIIDGKKVLIK